MGAPAASTAPHVAWVLPAIWGDPSPEMARAGLWFKAGRVARDSRAKGVPWRTWGVVLSETGDELLRFTGMRWRGWGTERVVVRGYAQLCYAWEPDCRRTARRHPIRLILTRLRDQTCGDESRTLFYTRYRLLGMPGIASRTHRSDRYC